MHFLIFPSALGMCRFLFRTLKIFLFGLFSSTSNFIFRDIYQFLRPSVLLSRARHFWAHIFPLGYSLSFRGYFICVFPLKIFYSNMGALWQKDVLYVRVVLSRLSTYFLSYPFVVEVWKVDYGFFAFPFTTSNIVIDMWLFVSHWSFCPQIF